MRLNAFLAKSGIASRRGADELIKNGRVKVNGRTGQLNDEVGDSDKVEVNGKKLSLQNTRYILLYKPAGYLTTLKDPHGRRKVTDLIDIKERVTPVGRLDYDTTGVLLLTNDGVWAHKLMHPGFEIDKVYEVTIEGNITGKILNMLSIGVQIDGQKTAPAKARQLAENKIELTIHEGRYHQVKKMMEAVGLKVVSLHRSKYGSLDLSGLKAGQWRVLTTAEIKRLSS